MTGRRFLDVPIAAWWLVMIVLTIIGSLFAVAWFLSGLLMLVNCVLTDQAERADGLS